MIELQQKIEEIAAPFLKEIDAFLVDISIVRRDQKKIILLSIDTDTGITIEQCASLNRKIGEALEQQELIQESYILEVSSPDLTKPVRMLRQYQKNIGRQFRVRYQKSGIAADITGKLEKIEGNDLTFVSDKKEIITVSFHEIIESIEELPW